MSRSGYIWEWDDLWAIIRSRGAVNSAIKGKRGQALLREMLTALDAMPKKRLIAGDLVKEGEVCALGAVAVAREIDTKDIDPYDRKIIGDTFNIASALAAEIAYINDEAVDWDETPEQRFIRVHAWVVKNLKSPDES